MTCSTRSFAWALSVAIWAATGAGPGPVWAQGAEQRDLDSLFTRREVSIPMRDGVKVFTVILTPRRAVGPLPIILSRTPYGTDNWGGTLGIEYGFADLIRDGYVFAFQDIRGRHQSGGEYIMNRLPRDRRDPKSIDESTDAYDTIDWLVHNVPNTNGRVGMLGISYPGWLTDMALIDPHPALRAVSPQATMGDTWIGDDFFHNGAFRQSVALEYAWQMEATKDESMLPAPGRYDTYEWYRSFPTLDSLTRAVGADRWPSWVRFATHPAYDAEWHKRAVPALLQHTTVPTLTVGGWWDQEDKYGPQATYRARERTDSTHKNFLVVGPWYHGEWYLEAGDSLGHVYWGGKTGEYFRREIEAPWFRYWLRDQGDGRFAEATVFDGGARQWRTFSAWPAPGAMPTNIYLQSAGRLSFEKPRNNGSGAAAADTFVSDPAHPVPYRPRPIEWQYDPRGSHWRQWLTEDQRFVEGRADVLSWQSEPLAHAITVAGDIKAELFASTTGSDADWIVKLIDVFPDSLTDRPTMGGYELMVASEIMRGRYREHLDHPTAIRPKTVANYSIDLHQQAYTFQKGHRMMVQVQSTWFPLYDRNPQTFVSNIFHASPSDFRAQTHRIYHTLATPSHIVMSVLPQ
ncbi:MAG: CocE/NonD family hydrolase [Gemmatimonadaceae bacterium]